MCVSVALLVRDEEHTLGRCLDCVAGAADETWWRAPGALRQALAICPGDAMHRQNLAFFMEAAEKAHG